MAPVVLDGAVGQENQAGAGVGDAVSVGVDKVVVADGVASGGKAPVAARAVDRRVNDGAFVLSVVNEAKVVVSVCQR